MSWREKHGKADRQKSVHQVRLPSKGWFSAAENHPFGTPRERKGLTPLGPKTPTPSHFSAAVCQSFSSERFGVLLFPLSRCCNTGTRAAAKSLETIQRQRPSGHRRRSSGHRRRSSRKPQQKSAGTPLHSACSISHSRTGNGRSRAQPLRSWGIERGPFFRQEWPPFTLLPKAANQRHCRGDENTAGGFPLVRRLP